MTNLLHAVWCTETYACSVLCGVRFNSQRSWVMRFGVEGHSRHTFLVCIVVVGLSCARKDKQKGVLEKLGCGEFFNLRRREKEEEKKVLVSFFDGCRAPQGADTYRHQNRLP